jgi:hypothetical protein
MSYVDCDSLSSGPRPHTRLVEGPLACPMGLTVASATISETTVRFSTGTCYE